MGFIKLLRVRASNYKNCCDDFTIDFVAKSKKTSEDKEYELLKIADELYVYNTVMIAGGNASGKTSALELLNCVYSILGEFRFKDDNQDFDEVTLEIFFYYEKYIFKYSTILKTAYGMNEYLDFTEQHLYRKKYYKSKVKEIFEDVGFEEVYCTWDLPEDTSILFSVLEKKTKPALHLESCGTAENPYQTMYKLILKFDISDDFLTKVMQMFDKNVRRLSLQGDDRSVLEYNGVLLELTMDELVHRLSEGTTKGVLLYLSAIATLRSGGVLLIDEIENQIDRKLIENLVTLFKDKTVNRQSASLVFTTHQYELLDLTNRQDNIWIAKSAEQVHLENLYDTYNLRPELIKSKHFYNNDFGTEVDYELLMCLKKELL